MLGFDFIIEDKVYLKDISERKYKVSLFLKQDSYTMGILNRKGSYNLVPAVSCTDAARLLCFGFYKWILKRKIAGVSLLEEV